MDIVKKDIGGNAEAEVVLYQPDSSIHIEVLVEGEEKLGSCIRVKWIIIVYDINQL